MAGSHHSLSVQFYLQGGIQSLPGAQQSVGLYRGRPKVSVLLCDRFAIKLRRKQVCHVNDIPPLTGEQQRPFVLGAEDSPGVTRRCAQLCNSNVHPHPAGICHSHLPLARGPVPANAP